MSQKKATIVNLAASHVSIAVFGSDQGSLELQQFLVEEIAPGQTNDDEWLGSAVNAVADLVQAHGLAGRRVTVIAPSFLLLQKALKVPQVERERQAQIVAFEAQNAIPYPLNEVNWDSQVMASDGVEAEVLLFALRTEVAARIATLIMGAGLRPASIQAAPLLDSQAFLLAGGAATEEVLIVNVGARSTTLSFVGPSGANIQSANIGGNLLTQGVSDNTGEPFANAEAVKVGYYSGVIHLPESDPKVAVLQANAQSFIRRLSQDINRRLINLKRGAAGRQPTRILLTGRGALIPGLSEQLSETLRLPPELFDPSAFLRLGKNVSADYVQHHRHQISEVIGEAARLVLPQTAGVNLIPRNIASQVAFDARKPWLIAAALIAALAPLPAYLAYSEAGSFNADQVRELKRRQADLNGHLSSLKTTREQALELQAVSTQLESVVLNQANWPTALADLQTRVASCKNTWVEEIRIRREAKAAAPAPAPADGQPVEPPAPQLETKVIVTARFLQPEVPPNPKASHNSATFIKRQNELLAALRKSPFIAEIPESEIKADFNLPYQPRVTFTLVIRKEKAL
jgi:type IV pilus assembly protein PilM